MKPITIQAESAPGLSPAEASARQGCGGCGERCDRPDCSICEGLVWCHRCERRERLR